MRWHSALWDLCWYLWCCYVFAVKSKAHTHTRTHVDGEDFDNIAVEFKRSKFNRSMRRLCTQFERTNRTLSAAARAPTPRMIRCTPPFAFQVPRSMYM